MEEGGGVRLVAELGGSNTIVRRVCFCARVFVRVHVVGVSIEGEEKKNATEGSYLSAL